MAMQLRKTLKSFFKRGAKPTESQFAQWLDACLLQGEDGIAKRSTGLEITQNLKISGSLIVEGTFWLAEQTQTASLHTKATQTNGVPNGAVFLYHGQSIPLGYGLCDGKDGRPLLNTPPGGADHLHYIIKLP
ncbi:hypothetical protein N473_09555 [Pseudoalteromonas luteoviolacea CPMOR-1]|uniref:Uncharacterized protein n=1 Tax=Pseudoalteromonas luteoviolacea CPMOR-1 TaxID=1365248 RepID=A0A167MMI7_9GAMM|nr:hypothetical protein [Pseudoalteromonas luteoviolacea]KZN66629.1 hypothetical protein N473_09555 [Pseudoalteromonas luteoviolacea CPMOR-1]